MIRSRPHVVIIGAGFGGLACARRLTKNDQLQVTLVDRTNHHLFQPLLYQVASSTLTAQDISRSIRSLFTKDEAVNIRYDLAEQVDLNAKSVHLASGGRLDFDYLVVAAGARTSFFGNDHWAEHVFQLKTIADAFEIRQRVLRNLELADRPNIGERDSLTTIVIVGGGPTGVELAGSFADLIKRNMSRSFRHFETDRQRIILLEGRERLLTPFDPSQSEYTREHLESLGVEVRTDCKVEDIRHQCLQLEGEETLSADVIIWAAGVEAANLTRSLGVPLSRSGQVKVGRDLSIPGHPETFVIGDAAAVEQEDGSFVPGVAPAATQGGIYVAEKILRDLNGDQREWPFRYVDKGKMAIVGRGSAVVDINGWQARGWFGWLIWLFVHLLFLIDFRSKFGVLIAWFWAYIHNTPGSRVLTTGSEETEGICHKPPTSERGSVARRPAEIR
ncbi:MAG: NAD(P)/FAD-dependent oxidoreductase [Verrucomicrobiota bacterium]